MFQFIEKFQNSVNLNNFLYSQNKNSTHIIAT
jgi:hypothetical protein